MKYILKTDGRVFPLHRSLRLVSIQSCVFLRDKNGKLTLEMNGQSVGSATTSGRLKPTGNAGITFGSDVSGDNGFVGSISGVRLIDTALSAIDLKNIANDSRRIAKTIRDLHGFPTDVMDNDAVVDTRFNQIKAIMQAAGVSDLSKLATLRITSRTRLTPGSILMAPAATTRPTTPLNWSKIAAQFTQLAATDPSEAKKLADSALVSRSIGRADALSIGTSAAIATDANGRAGSSTTPISVLDNVRLTVPTVNQPTLRERLNVANIGGRFNVTNLTENLLNSAELAELSNARLPEITLIEAVERLERDKPDDWPVFNSEPLMINSTVIPIDAAVVIARRFDLTNKTLEIDPAVGTLYIIAEDVEAAQGAQITWKRTPISVPNIGRDPSLDGRDRYGVDLAPNSKHGQPGGDAGDGAPGINGYHGQDAPKVEIWALRINGMPDIDLSGQQGGTGGRGQQGGEGGNGAQGKAGKWYWAFGKKCWKNPGNGGDGGQGGDGGRGGRGGTGGDAGEITFAVLPETLPALTTTNAFTVTLDGGSSGSGGNGGQRGEGGRGGARGFTKVCNGGRAGAQGQPGRVGNAGAGGASGPDGQMSIITIDQESWDEQLTRPWLYDVTPDAAHSGSSIVIKGSRFADTDQLFIDSDLLPSTLRADDGLDAVVPTSLSGGEHSLFIRRHDGQESNRLPLVIKPRLTGSLPELLPGMTVTLQGSAFLDGASVEFDGDPYPSTEVTNRTIQFAIPESFAGISTEREVVLAVINPDGQRSNSLSGTIPEVVSNGFRIGVHDFSFDNDSDGRPDWSTFEDTYGAVEVWHELLDPIFGHPVLTTAYYFFYEHFLKGSDNGGLATGFCTSLASIALDRYWQGLDDTFDSVVRDDAFRKTMTAVHGRLLAREPLLDFHDQGRRGNANVISTFREIESIFRSGGNRESAPMLFFVPSGAAWDAGYFDMLADSHCIVPTRIIYPTGHDGISLNGIRMMCWDNNHSNKQNCFVDFRVVGGETLFTYTANGSEKFKSEDGITLAVSTLGEYLLRDVDLPFGGPLGLTTFVLDFLLSPATIQIVNDAGQMTGNVAGQILSEIPGSHPAYLMPNAFLLPDNVGMTRRITGTDSGSYRYGSISPTGYSISLADVATESGQTDRVLTSGDGTRVRFIPGDAKTIDFALGRQVGNVARAISINQFAASPTDDLDITASPDLSLLRVSNRGGSTNIDVKLLGFDLPSQDRASLVRSSVALPTQHDLVIAVGDWGNLIDANVSSTVIEM